MLFLAPPLVITDAEVDRLVGVARDAVASGVRRLAWRSTNCGARSRRIESGHRGRSDSSRGDAGRDSAASRRPLRLQPSRCRSTMSSPTSSGCCRRWQVQVTHPRYFGLFNPSVTPASVVADTLVAMYNPQLATWRTSPGPNEIERHTLAWLRRQVRPAGRVGRELSRPAAPKANLSAVIVALTRAFPGYGEARASAPAGVADDLPDRRVASFVQQDRAHDRPRARGAAHRGDRRRLQDGPCRSGAAASPRIGEAACAVHGRRHGRHDRRGRDRSAAGAGGVLPRRAALVSRRRRVGRRGDHLAAPSAASRRHRAADSITCDAHKWFSVPMGAGMFFCRHPEAVGEAFRAETSYMPGKADGRSFDPYTTSVQWSRRFIGLKLFLALAERGEAGYVEMIEHQARMGDFLRESLARAGWRIVNATPLPLVCFTPRRAGDRADSWQALYERQIAWMSEVRLGRRRRRCSARASPASGPPRRTSSGSCAR